MNGPARGATAEFAGERLFARYAHAPNELGYCGPADSRPLLDAGVTGADPAAVRAAARAFHGAWPYLEIIARLAGIADPLDHRVVEAYWIGGGIGDAIDAAEFGRALLAHIKPQAGHYWRHLTEDVIEEAAPNHCFHVFGVYPWSRLLGPVHFEHPLQVLDGCRIRWATVLEREEDHLVVRTRRLTWDGGRLGLSEPVVERVARTVGGIDLLPGARPGDRVAVHWSRVCDVLTPEQVERLRRTTLAQLEATNRRLARGGGPA